MVRFLRRVVILPMAGQAVGREGFEASALVIRMAALTAGLQMGSFQGQASELVDAEA